MKAFFKFVVRVDTTLGENLPLAWLTLDQLVTLAQWRLINEDEYRSKLSRPGNRPSSVEA